MRIPALGGRGLAALTCGALLIRAAAAWLGGSFEPPRSRWAHGYEVGAIAVALAEGRGFADPFLVPTGPTAVSCPAMPALSAPFVRAFGSWSPGAWRSVLLLNLVFAALLVPAAHRLGRRAGGPVVATVAAALMAVHPHAILAPAGYLGSTGLFAVLATWTLERVLALEQAVAAGERPPWRSLGVVAGVGLWVEPLLLPVLLAWIVVSLAARRWALARSAALALAIAAAVASPWLLRNAVAFERPLFLRSWGGPELWLGAVAGPGDPTPVHLHPSHSPEEMAVFRELGEARYVHAKTQEAIRLIGARPGRWLLACASREGVYWFGRVSWWRRADHPLLSGPLAALRGPFWILAPLLAGAGLWSARRRSPEAARVLLIAFAAYSVTYALTHVEARYRLPLEPALMVGCALALPERWRGRSVRD